MRLVNCGRNSVVALGLAAVVSLGLGCSGKLKNEVTGKVTLDGKAVSGNLIFVGADKKELAPILLKPDGSYTTDLPPGEYTVAVRGMAGVGGGPAPMSTPTTVPSGVTKMPEMPGGAGSLGGTAPPEKYADAATSGLTFKSTGGKQTKDFPLTP